MNIIDRIKLMFVHVDSPTEKRPDDITSQKESMNKGTCAIGDKCCQAPVTEAKGCCADGECECK